MPAGGRRAGEVREAQLRQNVSGPVTAVVIAVVLIVFGVVFARSSLAPEEPWTFALPPVPPFSANERNTARQGLAPLGVTVVEPPLVLDRLRGVRVASVMPGSPADRAGMKPGDLLDRFDDRPVGHVMGLLVQINRTEAKRSYPAEVVRAGKRQKLVVSGVVLPPPEERVSF